MGGELMADEPVVQAQFQRLVEHTGWWPAAEDGYSIMLKDWVSYLRPVSNAGVIAAADAMIAAGTAKLPPLGDFLRMAQTKAREILQGPAQWHPDLPPETHSEPDDYAHEVIAVVRDFLKGSRTEFGNLDDSRGHDHRGPNPCPVCGGLNPKVGPPGPWPKTFVLDEPREPERARFACECGEMAGWVEQPDPRKPGTFVVRPCERCQSDRYSRWLEDVTGWKK
jgi:hypothetical protein